ncbi:MAG: IS110 family transposase [Deltaproteobacteria bacterium]|nr:IS110 family transposase [Deltaproteobacteria bacterium]
MKRMKTKKSTVVNEKTLIVAVDIGKTIHWGYFRTPNNIEVKPFPFQNGIYSFNAFLQRMQKFQQEQELEEIVVGFESTGPYAEPLCHFLRKRGVKLVQVNPMHTKRLKDLTGNSPNKTDQKDPRVIADVISLNHGLTVVIPQGVSAELRRLAHAREQVVCDLTAKSNKMQQLVFIIFPEFFTIMKKAVSKSVLFLLKNYPLPEDIVELGIETLTDRLKKISRGKLRKQRAQELIEAARQSIGIDSGTRSIALEIKYIVDSIEHAQQFIFTLETEMKEYLRHVPYSCNILSLKGIGVITAAGLIGEVGDFKAFATAKELEKMAGLNLYEISSGAHKGKRRISKRGRSLMRKLLYCAALNTIRTNGIMYQQYHKMLDRGMPKLKAVVAISRRLLRIIYALVRDNTMFEVTHCSKTCLKKVA